MHTHSGYEGRDDENENELMSSSSIRNICAQSTPYRSSLSLSLSSSSSLSTISSPLKFVSEMELLSSPSSSSTEEGEEFFLQSIHKRIWKSLSTVSAVTNPSTASNSRGGFACKNDSDEVESDLDLELGSEARISFDDVSELEPENVIFYSTSNDSLNQHLQQQQEQIDSLYSWIMEEDDDEEPSGKKSSSSFNSSKYVLDDTASSKCSRTMKESTPRSKATEQSRKTIATEHTRKTMASEPRSIATEHSRTTKASKPRSITTEQKLQQQQQQQEDEEDIFKDKDIIQLVRNIESELDLYGLDDDTTQNTDDDGHVVVDFGMSDDSSADMPKISNDNCSMACTSITSSTSFERSITFSSFLDKHENVENDDGDYNIIEFTTMVDPKMLRTTTKNSSNSDKKMIEEERCRDDHIWCVRYRKWMMFLFALIFLGFSVVLVIELLRSRNMV